MSQKVILNKGQFAIVDDQDILEVINFGSWYYGTDGYAQINRYTGVRINDKKKYKVISLHKFIAQRMGIPSNCHIDHINLNKLDCRRENLRIANNQLNNANREVQSNNKLGIKGVSKIKSGYRVRIKKDRVLYNLGVFKTVEEAKIAYNKKALELFGEYARLNN